MAHPHSDLWFASSPDDHNDVPSWRRVVSRAQAPSSDQPRSTTDNDLVAAIRTGNEQAFDTFFRAEFPRVVRFATALLGAKDSAEEAAAEVFLKIWRARAQWDPQGPVTAYLFRAVRNQALNARRAARRADNFQAAVDGADHSGGVPGMAQPEPLADVLLERAEIERELWSAIDALSPERRAIAYLRWREGMSYEAIGGITGQSSEAVKKQANRVIAALRTRFGDLKL